LAGEYLAPAGRAASRFLLSGIARCGYCDKALVGHGAKGGRFSYYVCGTLLKKGAGACRARYLNSKRSEGLVVDKIREHILTEENLKELVHLVNEEMDAASQEYQRQLDLVIDEIADVDRRLDRLYDTLETGYLKLGDLAPRIKFLKARKDSLEARKCELEWQTKQRKLELADAAIVTRYVQDLRSVLSSSSGGEKVLYKELC
jgi:site-specific DNA recombinase